LVLAQQSSVPAPNSPEQSKQEQKAKSEAELQREEQSQRILGIVPMFSITNRSNAAPLTPGQKFHLFTRSAFDPIEIPIYGFQAGISQALDEFPGYGQGAAGYGKRFGATMADGVSSNFFSNFLYPTLFKEDPRYFRLGQGHFKRRFFYALTRPLVTHKDAGGRSFNYSSVFGAFSSGGLSNIYYPSDDRGFGLTVSRSSIQLAYGSLGGLVDEFWPDIQRKMFQKKRKGLSN
jgi:hypothetical protein